MKLTFMSRPGDLNTIIEAMFPSSPRHVKTGIQIPTYLIKLMMYAWERGARRRASPFREDLAAYGDDCSSAAAAKDDHIYLDAMGFGMGLCCLQLTFQVRPHRHYSGDT